MHPAWVPLIPALVCASLGLYRSLPRSVSVSVCTDHTPGLCLCLSAQITPQVGLHVPRSVGSCSVSGHTHSATAWRPLGMNKSVPAYTEAVAVLVLHRLRPHLLCLSLSKAQPELSKDTCEVSLFLEKTACLCFLFLPSSKLLWCIFF